MAEERTINWSGQSGQKYQYWIYPIGTTFKAIPGNYIFAKETKPHTWRAVYVGETDDLNKRLSNPNNHEKLPCVRRYSGTHIHTHASSDNQRIRQQEEADIRKKENPPCNLED